MTNDETIETFNKFMVGVDGRGVVIMNPPRGAMSKADAKLLAAWLAMLSGDFECVDIMKIMEGCH